MNTSQYKKEVLSLEPIKYIERYALTLATAIYTGFETNQEGLNSTITFMIQALQSEDLRTLQIDKDIIELLDNTENDYIYRNSAYDLFFVNEEINIDNYILKGVFVVNMNCPFLKDETNNKTKNDYFVCGIAIDKNNMEEETYFKFRLIDFDKHRNKENAFMWDIRKKLYKVIFNLLDLINNNEEDIKIIKIIPNEHKKHKQNSKKYFPLREKIIIRPTKTLYKYICDFKSGQRTYDFKFMVRGHYKHFINERYKEARGTSVWIKPFYKGEGIIHNKVIQIKGGI